MKDKIFKHWKSTLAGLFIMAIGGYVVYYEQALTVLNGIMIITGAWLFSREDKLPEWVLKLYKGIKGKP